MTDPERDRVTDCIIAALRRAVHDESVPITPETQPFVQLGLDSTNLLEVLMDVEDELDIVLEADSIEQQDFHTVGALSERIAVQIRAGRD
jgi:acyl carrier protein